LSDYRFKPGDKPTEMIIFVDILSPFIETPGLYFQSGHDRFLAHHLQSNIQYSFSTLHTFSTALEDTEDTSKC
jgi:hypothetical protein